LRAEFANIEDNPNLNIMGGPRRMLIEEMDALAMVYDFMKLIIFNELTAFAWWWRLA
jgi:hypothetical protein